MAFELTEVEISGIEGMTWRRGEDVCMIRAKLEALKRTKQEREAARTKQTATMERRRKAESGSMSPPMELPAVERDRRRWNASRR